MARKSEPSIRKEIGDQIGIEKWRLDVDWDDGLLTVWIEDATEEEIALVTGYSLQHEQEWGIRRYSVDMDDALTGCLMLHIG